MATINTYDLNYTDAFKLGIKNYANFNGRASRSEYWRFAAGITIFLIQSIQIADIVGELLWFGLNGNGYM